MAARLAAGLGEAVPVPMDGFHLDNRLLEAEGLRGRKGAPGTFDADGFVALVRRLKSGGEVVHPVFDRALDLAVAGAGRVAADDRLVVVEGNYLLLDRAPWRELAGLWDLSVMLDVPMAELRRRLTARWQALGCSAAEVAAHLENDLGHVDKWRSHSLMQAMSMKPRKLSAVLS